MPAVIFGWGIAMAVIGLVGVLFYGFAGPEPPALFFGTAGLIIAVAAFLRFTRFGRDEAPGARATPDISAPVPWLAAAVVLGAVGAELGLWLVLIAAGMGAIGLAALAREGLAQREAARSAAPDLERRD